MKTLPPFKIALKDTFALMRSSLPSITFWVLLLTLIGVSFALLTKPYLSQLNGTNPSGISPHHLLLWEFGFMVVVFALDCLILSLVNQRYQHQQQPFSTTVKRLIVPYIKSLIVVLIGSIFIGLLVAIGVFLGTFLYFSHMFNTIVTYVILGVLILIFGYLLIRTTLRLLIAMRLPILQNLGIWGSFKKSKQLLNGHRCYTLFLIFLIYIPASLIGAAIYYYLGEEYLSLISLILEPAFISMIVVHIHNLDLASTDLTV